MHFQASITKIMFFIFSEGLKMVKSEEKNTLIFKQLEDVCASCLSKTHFSLGEYISVTLGKMTFIQKQVRGTNICVNAETEQKIYLYP